MIFPATKYLDELGLAVPVAFGFLIAETLFLATYALSIRDYSFYCLLSFTLIIFFTKLIS